MSVFDNPINVTVVVKNSATRISVVGAAPLKVIQVARGPAGPPGPPGPPGPATSIQAPCGVVISGGTVVVMVDEMLYPADPTDASDLNLVIGVVAQSGNPGDVLTVYPFGEVGGLSLTPGSRYYVGLNGTLSMDSMASGAAWFRSIGRALTSSILLVQLGAPVLV